VGVAADDQRYVKSLKDRQEAFFGCQTCEALVFVSWCGMAKQDIAQSVKRKEKSSWPGRQQSLVFGMELLGRPAYGDAGLFWEGI
jgi:hypothetical protein